MDTRQHATASQKDNDGVLRSSSVQEGKVPPSKSPELTPQKRGKNEEGVGIYR